MAVKTRKPEVYRFARAKGLAKMRDIRDFANYVGKKLGFQISADGLDIQETVEGVHIKGGMATGQMREKIVCIAGVPMLQDFVCSEPREIPVEE